MRGIWRANTKAWINTIIMKEWLLAFYAHIGPRKVLLVMDNFPAHGYGLVEIAPAPANIRIQRLPANATSQFQPLDQGIIKNVKSYYRKQWLSYMLTAYENLQNPINTDTILHAIRWSIRAWNHDVSSTTINNCFRKSTLMEKPIQLPNISPNISNLFMQVTAAGSIQDAMSIENFLNPPDESTIPDDNTLTSNELLDEIIANHIGDSIEPIEEEEDGGIIMPIPTTSEALQAIKLLISYSESQANLVTSPIQGFERFECDLERNISEQANQRTLDSYFGIN
jgi:hypothetical protein